MIYDLEEVTYRIPYVGHVATLMRSKCCQAIFAPPTARGRSMFDAQRSARVNHCRVGHVFLIQYMTI